MGIQSLVLPRPAICLNKHVLVWYVSTVTHVVQSTGESPLTEVDELKKNFRAVQEENYKLQAVITDVTEVNKRWQKYNNDRQMYVQRLLSTIQDQQEQMNKIVETRTFPSLQQIVPGENHKNIEAVHAENAKLKEDIAKLQKRIEKLEQEHREHVELLEFQVKANKDDWEAERSEKQQALQEKSALELRIKELQKENRSLKLKLKEERSHKPHNHCVHCCGVYVCETGHCSAGAVGKHCHRDNPKTYRTSVHLPCASGHLLSRGTTLYFGDDLTTDGDEAHADEVDKPVMTLDTLRSRSSSLDCSPPPLSPLEPVHQTESDGNNNFANRGGGTLHETAETTDRPLGLNISTEDNSGHEYRRSVLHISPTSSGSNLTTEDLAVDSSASGVTIGFSSGGLASVTSFSQRPVVKSSSLPISEKINFDGDSDMKATMSGLSLDSGWASVVGPPPTNDFFKDNFQEKKAFKMLSSKNLTKSEGNVTTTNVRKASVPWKAKYFEEGVATQTREDVICPGCGQVFPPSLHLKFLDHFEICQKNVKDVPKRTSIVRSRN
ncbi:uncharacterized protein [Periplaneta americana]|uniref:uncharacterized protein isoform X3 n=1 Tax=Periplaneta americana TaxID=6978 RepID=UPI0037E945A3